MMRIILKIYHTQTREEYDYLMQELEQKGYEWKNGLKPTEHDEWNLYKGDTFILLDADKKLFTRSAEYDHEYSPFSIPVTLPTQATTDNVEKPRHYQGIYGLEVEEVLRNFIPRYENGYTAHRAGSAIEYLLRAPLKNGVEDIKKAHRNLGMLLEELGEDETI